jgi:hypothetical protein
MSTTKLEGGSCQKCGVWVGHGSVTLCIDCKRKKKERAKCQFKHPITGIECHELFDQVGSRKKFCIMHRGLHIYVPKVKP